MKVLKYLGQILASLIYPSIFTGVMYLVIVLPLAWVCSLPWWGMLLVIGLGGAILEGIIQLLVMFGMIPFVWIVNRNIVALGISLLTVVGNLGRSGFIIWRECIGQGFWAITFAVIVTGILLHLLVATVTTLLGSYADSKN